MKHIVSSLAIACAAVTTTVGAQVIEFSQLASASLQAPLPVIPNGTSYIGNPPYTKRSPLVLWGVTKAVVPSIRFDVYDDKGVQWEDKCPSLTSPPVRNSIFPKHLGTDYAGPAGTPVYAIADGVITRVNTFTDSNDYYVVIESGSTNKWTTLYGHLNKPPSYPSVLTPWIDKFNRNLPVKKGDQIGVFFNYNAHGDIPHLHMGIRKGAYDSSTAVSAKGYVCEVSPSTLKPDATYYSNKYNFVSPEVYRYYTPYY
jgi:Peptidase family M23